jgi:hypothetical protein
LAHLFDPKHLETTPERCRLPNMLDTGDSGEWMVGYSEVG